MKQTESVKQSFFESIVKEYAGYHVDYKIKRDGVIITQNNAYIPKDINGFIEYLAKELGGDSNGATLLSINYRVAGLDGCIVSYDKVKDTVFITSSSSYKDITYFAVRHKRFSTANYVQEGGFYVIYDTVGDVEIPYKAGDFPEEDRKIDKIVDKVCYKEPANYDDECTSSSNLYLRVPDSAVVNGGRVHGPIAVLLSSVDAVSIANKLIEMADVGAPYAEKTLPIFINQLSRRYIDLFNDMRETCGIRYSKLHITKSKRYKDMAFDKGTMLPIIPSPSDMYRIFVLLRITEDGTINITAESTDLYDIDVFTSNIHDTKYIVEVGIYVDLKIGYDMKDTVFYYVSNIGDENIFDKINITEREEEPIMETSCNLYRRDNLENRCIADKIYGPIGFKMKSWDAKDIAEALAAMIDYPGRETIVSTVSEFLEQNMINIDGADTPFNDRYDDIPMIVTCAIDNGKMIGFRDKIKALPLSLNHTTYRILVGFRIMPDTGEIDVFATCPKFRGLDDVSGHYINDGNTVAAYIDMVLTYGTGFVVYLTPRRFDLTNIYAKSDETTDKPNIDHESNLYYMPKYNCTNDNPNIVNGPIATKLSTSDALGIARAAVKLFGIDDSDNKFLNSVVDLLVNNYIEIDGTDEYDQYAEYESMQVICDVEDGKITAFHDINHGRLVPISRTMYRILVGIKISDKSDYADIFAICPEFGTCEQIPEIGEGENAIAMYADVFIHHDDDYNVYAFVSNTYATNIYQERMRYAPYSVPKGFKPKDEEPVVETKCDETVEDIADSSDEDQEPDYVLTPCDIINSRISAAIASAILGDYEESRTTMEVFVVANQFLENTDIWGHLMSCETNTIEMIVDNFHDQTPCRLRAYIREMTIADEPGSGHYLFEIIHIKGGIIINTFFNDACKYTDYISTDIEI